MNLTILKAWINAKFNTDERGASMVEYALLVALIAAICVAGVGLLGGKVNNKFSSVSSQVG